MIRARIILTEIKNVFHYQKYIIKFLCVIMDCNYSSHSQMQN